MLEPGEHREKCHAVWIEFVGLLTSKQIFPEVDKNQHLFDWLHDELERSRMNRNLIDEYEIMFRKIERLRDKKM